MPVAVHAEESPRLFREAGAWFSVARSTHGGSSVEASMAERIPILDLAASAFVRLELLRWGGAGFGMQPEVAYAPRGADLRLGIDEGGFRARYLELPILARIESSPIGPAALYAVAGPTLSFLLSSETESGSGFVADTTDITTRMDFGLAAGVGATVEITPRLALGFETRYTHGFVTIDETREFQVENRAFVFSLGVSARLGVDEAVAVEE
jgi:hypothetical protein